jgi:hypothetical protein
MPAIAGEGRREALPETITFRAVQKSDGSTEIEFTRNGMRFSFPRVRFGDQGSVKFFDLVPVDGALKISGGGGDWASIKAISFQLKNGQTNKPKKSIEQSQRRPIGLDYYIGSQR